MTTTSGEPGRLVCVAEGLTVRTIQLVVWFALMGPSTALASSAVEVIGVELDPGVSPAFREIAREKRAEAIRMMEELLRRGKTKAAVRDEMSLRLCTLYFERGVDELRQGSSGAESLTTAKSCLSALSAPEFVHRNQVLFYLGLAEANLGLLDEGRDTLAQLLADDPSGANVPAIQLALDQIRARLEASAAPARVETVPVPVAAPEPAPL
ncbi:MAG: hypothetical protein ACI8PZ_003265 [Myxococcota bacterium]|jgi:hypothetical protein